MFEQWKSFLTRPSVLLAVLLIQVLLYWTIAVYKLGEAVPVAYQRF
jgi:hypothetical protein